VKSEKKLKSSEAKNLFGTRSAMVGEFCRRITSTNPPDIWKTDKPENVTFYKRFGFEVVDEHPLFGIKNRFMLRDARG
jgi:hypothetical protein